METETKPLWTTTREAMGRTWTVQLYPNNTGLEGGDFTCDLAQVRHSQQIIAVNAIQRFEGRDEALLHEFLHIASRFGGNRLEERDVECFGQILYSLLRGFGLWRDFPWPDKKK